MNILDRLTEWIYTIIGKINVAYCNYCEKHGILRTWVERATGAVIKSIIPIGYADDRRLYAIMFADGTDGDYFVDFDGRTVEPY